jgi:hypothetical protein
MGEHTCVTIRKGLAILLTVLFVVSLTAVATSAAPPCKGPIPDCIRGYHLSCVAGHWKCMPNGPGLCKGPIPRCLTGYHDACVNGQWQCVTNEPESCPGPRPLCIFGFHSVCVNGQWKCVHY